MSNTPRRIGPARAIAYTVAAFFLFFGIAELALLGAARTAYYFKVTRYNPVSRPADDGSKKYRIVTFGDSVTAGQGTAPRYSYPRNLESLLNEANPGDKFEVINQGVFALNSSRLADLLPGWLDEFSPDAIVIMTGCNNAWNYRNSHLEELGLMERNKLQVLLNKTRTYRFLRVATRRAQVGFGIAEEQQGDIVPVLRDNMKISPSVSPATDPTAATLERQRTIFKDAEALDRLLEYDMTQMLREARSRGVEVILMTYPFVPPYQDHRGLTRRFALEHKLLLVDNYADFQRIKGVQPGLDLFSADRGHPNATGYRVVGAGIYEQMRGAQERLGIELAATPDPLADFKDLDYLRALYAEVEEASGKSTADEYTWETLGHVAVELEDWAAAETAFKTAFEVSGGAPQFYESLGNLFVQREDWEGLKRLKADMLAQRGDRNDISFLMQMFDNAIRTGEGQGGWGQQRSGPEGGPEGGAPAGPDGAKPAPPSGGAEAPATGPTSTPAGGRGGYKPPPGGDPNREPPTGAAPGGDPNVAPPSSEPANR